MTNIIHNSLSKVNIITPIFCALSINKGIKIPSEEAFTTG